jgi:hypothetical protein
MLGLRGRARARACYCLRRRGCSVVGHDSHHEQLKVVHGVCEDGVLLAGSHVNEGSFLNDVVIVVHLNDRALPLEHVEELVHVRVCVAEDLLFGLEGRDRKPGDAGDNERLHELLLQNWPSLFVLVRRGPHGQVVKVHDAPARWMASAIGVLQLRGRKCIGDESGATIREENAAETASTKNASQLKVRSAVPAVVPWGGCQERTGECLAHHRGGLLC